MSDAEGPPGNGERQQREIILIVGLEGHRYLLNAQHRIIGMSRLVRVEG